MDTKCNRLGRLAIGLLVAHAAGAVWAQKNPYYVGAAQTVTRESNFTRAAGGQAIQETFSTTSLLAGLDQPIGRQRLFADGAVRLQRYNGLSSLNHTDGSLLAGLDWAAADAFAGRLSYSYDKSLAQYGVDFGFNDLNTLVTQTSQELALRGQYGLVGLLSIEGGYVHRKFAFSTPSGSDFNQDAVSAGLKYRPGGSLTLGIGYRRTDGTYPNSQITILNPAPPPATITTFGADDFKRNDIDLTAVWVVTGQSTVTARLSRTSEKHTQGLSRDVSGSTGAMAWNYKPTGKLIINADWIRDTGAESTFNAGAAGGLTPIVNSSPLATTYQLRGEYEATAKIQVTAAVRYFKRDLVNTAGDRGTDSLVETQLGVIWAPLRSVQVGCSLGREKRDASDGAVNFNLSTAYTSRTTRCLAQFKTQ
jgi:hypothetical protein